MHQATQEKSKHLLSQLPHLSNRYENAYLTRCLEDAALGPISSVWYQAHNLHVTLVVPHKPLSLPVTWASGPLLSILAGADIGGDADAIPTAKGAEG